MSCEIGNLLKELRLLFRVSADSVKSSSEPAARCLEEAVRQFARLSSRIKSQRFSVAFAGLTNVGKSTFMNALFGLNLAPRSNCPWSSAPVEYVYGEELGATVVFEKDIFRHVAVCESADELSELIRRAASEDGDLAQMGIRKITITLPVNVLQGGLVIVDTPGFGAAQVGNRKGEHERVLLEYLPRADQVFWIISSEQGITSREKGFHDQFLSNVCDDIVVNVFDDEYDDNDKKRFLERFRPSVGISKRWYFLSAIEALKAKLQENRGAMDKSGIRLLEQRMWQVASLEDRRDSALKDAISLCEDVAYHLRDQHAEIWPPWPETDMKAVLHAASFRPELREKMNDILRGIIHG